MFNYGYGIVNNCGGGGFGLRKIEPATSTSWSSIASITGVTSTDIVDISADPLGGAFAVSNVGKLYYYSLDDNAWTELGILDSKNIYPIGIAGATFDNSIWVLADKENGEGVTGSKDYRIYQYNTAKDTYYKYSMFTKAEQLEAFDFMLASSVDKDGTIYTFDVKLLFFFSVNGIINSFLAKFIDTIEL
mmetsp:Transcript_2988/g.2832  ORF Transcript_2988/g.2832 Transcript_2988/m.2832 type:complete len:189 (-) Transcript_2988:49-615(-)